MQIICVVGPTAAGKSEMALRICEQFHGELVSVDSMQVYRKMDIGTAKPTIEEQTRVRHHLIDICEPTESFSAGDFTNRAHIAIADILSRGKIPVLCGGTGLYMDSVVSRLNFGDLKADTSLRDELWQFAEKNGTHALHQILEQEDPEAAKNIHENNVKRVIRAIEICRTSGQTKTNWDAEAKATQMPYDALWIGINYQNRDTLYERINKRVDIMMQNGLLAETQYLLNTGILEKNQTAAAAIGYKELLGYLHGTDSLDEAVEKLKIATRHFAKRQLTWTKRNEHIHWFYPDQYCDYTALQQDVFALIHNQLEHTGDTL